MIRVNTTVVCVAAPPGSSPLDGVRASNVRIARPDPDAAALDRAREVWQQATATSSAYLLHDADPLAAVAAAWAARFDGTGVVGDLEVVTQDLLARWRAGSLDLPDYYMVLEPEELSATMRHWYFGVLAATAPRRVVAGRPATALVDHLPGLQPCPWWPPLDRIVDDLGNVVPDVAGGQLLRTDASS